MSGFPGNVFTFFRNRRPRRQSVLRSKHSAFEVDLIAARCRLASAEDERKRVKLGDFFPETILFELILDAFLILNYWINESLAKKRRNGATDHPILVEEISRRNSIARQPLNDRAFAPG